MTDKRIRPYDRRLRIDTPDIPFMDSKGNKIRYNRRVNPDRRINSIEVEELEWPDDEDTA
jgi:hypothetical protein